MWSVIFTFLGNLLGIIRNVQENKNTKEMKKAAETNEEIKKQDETKKAILNEDIEKIRREVS